MSAITQFLPKNHLSYIVGQLVHMPLPSFVWTPIIKIFAWFYKIDLSEAEKPVSEYTSLGDFFVRKLKPGIRPVGDAWALHPADSVITQSAVISYGKLIQAKNKTYNVNEFLSDPQGLSKFEGGQFATYYLCPTDYHRVHSPVDGVITKVIHIPGALWPVNQWSTENIQELFSINERVYVEIKTNRGLVGLVFVAATNVGHIELSFDSEIHGNQFRVFKPLMKENLNISISRGEEIGLFRMGSTVVMLYSKDCLAQNTVQVEPSSLIQKSVKVNSNFLN